MAESIVRQPGAASSQHSFSDLPAADVQRSTFDRSHGWKSTIPTAGLLYPCFVDEMVPGDSISIQCNAFVRLATPLKPIMDTLHVQVHFFACAMRLLQHDFVNVMGERNQPDDDISGLTIDTVPVPLDQAAGTVFDYLGLPIGQPATVEVSALYPRAYHFIANEWYNDQNINDRKGIDTNISYDSLKDLRWRNKTKDYFSSAQLWPQKGDEVIIPLGQYAEVIPDPDKTGAPQVRFSGANDGQSQELGLRAGGDNFSVDAQNATQAGSFDRMIWTDPQLVADLASATATSINDLRTAWQVQRLLERDARSGTRYIESVLAFFAVESDDRRQFRPEYLGGGSGTMNVTPVAATVPTEEAAQGELAAVGTGITRCSISHAFTEHSVVMGILSIKSELTYQQGIDKMWLRRTRYDFYYPVFAHLGEQAIQNRELYVSGDEQIDNATFGFAERWSEMKFKHTRLCGDFRSNSPASLDVWHLAQDFEETPTLSQPFIRDEPPIDRVIAVPAEPHFLADVWFNYKHTRPMPIYSVPGLVDHF